MRLVLSWLREFVDTDRPATEIADGLGLRGFEVAAVEPLPNGDAVIDFEVTANRPDCLSVIGLAREVATLYDRPLQPPSTRGGAPIALATLNPGSSDRLTVTVLDRALCPRYAAAVADVAVGPSPDWMASRLVAAGVRPINSIVDVTNYVLIELGHPTHAFDLDRLAGAEIRVRRAVPGERLTTLDGVDRQLDPDMLVIADRDRPQAVAGVMGGASAEVSPGTRRVAFESAYFRPACVRRTSKRLGVMTEASMRFERGADVNAPVVALQRIGALLTQVGAGYIVGPVIDHYPERRGPIRILLRRQRLSLLLGVAVPDGDVRRILHGLGLPTSPAPEGWEVEVPTFRIDVSREADLIEEVGRHFGFDNIGATFPVLASPPPPADARLRRDQRVRRVLTAAGLSEAVTFGFIESGLAELFAAAGANPAVRLANPLSAKFDTLRPLLVPGLIDAVAHNRRHGRDAVRLFEIGTRFSVLGETRAVAVACTGAAAPTHWSGGARPTDFFDVKGIVERLCGVLGVVPRFETSSTEGFLVPGRAASVLHPAGPPLGFIGLLDPAAADARGLSRGAEIFVAELNLDALGTAALDAVAAVVMPPRYPGVVRDLSVLVRDSLPAEIIRGTIQAAATVAPAPLVDVTFFDRYQGRGVPDGSVSLSFRLRFQASTRTLTDGDVQESVEQIVAALVQTHGAVQR
jgi:phenylalanyl-tRNA synthetase beta chain